MFNERTKEQIYAILALEKLKKYYLRCSNEEKIKLHNEYPDIFVNR